MNLSAPPQFTGLNEAASSHLIRLRNLVAPILANNLLPHFTDHSVDHSDNIVCLVGKLMSGQWNKPQSLTEEELLILYSACYLHDIGMHYELILELDVVPPSEVSGVWDNLTEDTRRILLRKYHHLASARLVQSLVANGPTLIGFTLDDCCHPAYVAALCEAHGLDTRLGRYRELTADKPNMRMSFLSGLLRMADILDESRRRAMRAKARTLDLDMKSQVHWWRHYYTEDVTFDSQDKTIEIHFDFPPKQVDEYSSIVPELQVPVVREELERHRRIFAKNGLSWNITHSVSCLPYSTTEIMPDDVHMEMVKELAQHRAQQAQEQREADLRVFDEARPVLRRKKEKLEHDRNLITPGEYLKRLFSLAQHWWELGGRRAACMMLLHPFECDCNNLSRTERVLMALAIAEWLQKDNQPYVAQRVLSIVECEITYPDLASEIQRFWSLVAQCANECADHSRADSAIEELRMCKPQGNQWDNLLADHLEWVYLRGNRGSDAEGYLKSLQLDEYSICDSDLHREFEDIPFLDQVSALVRKHIVLCRVTAHQTGAEQALADLSYFDHDDFSRADVLALELCRAEILSTDGSTEKACGVLDKIVTDYPELPASVELTVRNNRALTRFTEFKFEDDYYTDVDKRRKHGITFWNDSKILSGMISAELGKHYEAVPAFWIEACHAYRRSDWQGKLWAHFRLAKEYYQIGHLDVAAWHAMLALDEKIAKTIGVAICSTRQPQIAANVLSLIIPESRLRRHAGIASIVIGEFVDIIPDEHIDSVFTFLRELAEEGVDDNSGRKRWEAAWSSMDQLLPRLDEARRESIVQLAIKHPFWMSKNPKRRILVSTVTNACWLGIPETCRTELVEALIPLATESKDDFDYREVIDLAAYLSEFEDSKNRLSVALFPDEKNECNLILAQIASLFGKHIHELDKLAKEAITQIKLQVQRLSIDEQPQSIGMVTTELVRDQQKLVVSLRAGVESIATLARHKRMLSTDTVLNLVDAMYAMIEDVDNDLSNKYSLIEYLCKFADMLDETTVARVIELLRPIAEGNVNYNSGLMPCNDPLSRVSINTVTLGQLRGIAVLAISRLTNCHPGMSLDVDSMMASALTEGNSDVRMHAFAAFRELVSVSSGTLSAILVGTQDTDVTVARVAWVALGEVKKLEVSDELWPTVVMVLRKALQHFDFTVRKAAAVAGVNLAQVASEKHGFCVEINNILMAFKSDTSYSVRRALECKQKEFENCPGDLINAV